MLPTSAPVLCRSLTSEGEPRTGGVAIEATHIDSSCRAARSAAPYSEVLGGAATGKIVVATHLPRPTIAVFQNVNGHPTPAWCANVTPAGLALLGVDAAAVRGPGGVEVWVEVDQSPEGTRQRWTVSTSSIEWPGWNAGAWHSAVLNAYRIIVTDPDPDPDPDPAEYQGLGLEPAQPKTCKSAFIECSRDGCPARVRFHTGQRWHGAAPLTGLAELVVAGTVIDEIRGALGPHGAVRLHDGRVEALPTVSIDGTVLQIGFAPRRIELIARGGHSVPTGVVHAASSGAER